MATLTELIDKYIETTRVNNMIDFSMEAEYMEVDHTGIKCYYYNAVDKFQNCLIRSRGESLRNIVHSLADYCYMDILVEDEATVIMLAIYNRVCKDIEKWGKKALIRTYDSFRKQLTRVINGIGTYEYERLA